MTNSEIYIYCVVPAFYSDEMFVSLENQGIRRISHNKISALVADTDVKSIDYKDRESLGSLIIQHQLAIEKFMERGFMHLLPFRIGTIVESEEEVVKILSAGYKLINDTFKKIQFMTEMDLAVTWSDFPSTLKKIADDPEIAAAKTTTQNDPAISVHDEQMKNWILVRSKLKERSIKAELNILDFLSPLCLDIKPHDVMNYQMISNSAFLINRTDQGEFEQMVSRLDNEYKGNLNFKIIGPLPCYSFFTLESEKIRPDNVLKANIELGLQNETSESVIRKAYIKKTKMFHPDVHLKNGEEDYFNSITKAYHTLLDYSSVARRTLIHKEKENSTDEQDDNLILVKLKT